MLLHRVAPILVLAALLLAPGAFAQPFQDAPSRAIATSVAAPGTAGNDGSSASGPPRGLAALSWLYLGEAERSPLGLRSLSLRPGNLPEPAARALLALGACGLAVALARRQRDV